MKRAIIGLVFAVIAVAAWLAVRPNRDAVLRPSGNPAPTPPSPNDGLAKSGDAEPTFQAGTRVAGISAEDLESVRRLIGEGSDPQRVKALLGQLSEKLAAISPEKAAGLLRDALSSRLDAVTKLPFAIGDGGNLATAPTFRVWLLDQLGRTDPQAAADYAKQILATRESADEWAVALRDFARVRGAAGDVAFLNGKMRELLGDPRWQAEQSAGWLEAFDVAVHAKAVELTPDLARLLMRTGKQDKAAAHAAFLTLDRLVQAAPADMLTRVQAEPGLMKGRELTRANYFARADVRDARQREIVERYILDPARSAEELAKFAGLYPNANMMISKNLLTPTVTPSREDIILRDREALRVAREWAADPRFAPLQAHVQAIQTRLRQFVGESEK